MNNSFDLIYNDLNVDVQSEDLSEEQLLDIIGDRVAWFLEHDKDLLLSYLYRLDIEERHIEHALSLREIDPAHIAIAKLIFKRQKQRMEFKKNYKVEPIEGWEF